MAQRGVPTMMPTVRLEDLKNRGVFDGIPDRALMYSLMTENEIGDCIVMTDAAFGGRTVARLAWKEYNYFGAALFEGELDWESDTLGSRGGFANFRTDREVKDCGDYAAFEVRLKGDGKRYRLNFQTSERSDDDVYQCVVDTEPGVWLTVGGVFGDMVLMHRGYRDLRQVDINPETVNGFGVTIADNQSGPFAVEVQYVAAVADWDPRQYGMQLSRRKMMEAAVAAQAESQGGDEPTSAPAAGEVVVDPYVLTDEQRQEMVLGTTMPAQELPLSANARRRAAGAAGEDGAGRGRQDS